MTGPVPPFTNPPIEPQNFQPSNFTIQSIAMSGLQASVTTTDDNNYVVGQQVRFHIPLGYGMAQLNDQSAFVSQVNSTTNFLANIDIRFFDPLVTPGFPLNQQTPQVSAIGDQNFGTLNPNGFVNNTLTIPGAFQNISNGAI